MRLLWLTGILLYMQLIATRQTSPSIDAAARARAPATTQPAAASSATGILFKSLDLDGERFVYSVYVPLEYDPDKEWPVILFLCGSGDTGDDGLRPLDSGIGRVLRRDRRMIPAIVVFPQCRPNSLWTGKMARMALRCLEQTSREYNLDHERVYLTGLSLGGAGAWSIGTDYAQHFAAIVPICGFLDNISGPAEPRVLERTTAALRDVPIWTFHGGADRNVPVQRTREIVAALRQAGNRVQYTEYPEVGHTCWDKAYDDRELWRWLFAQRRSERGKSSPATQPANP